jgi:hypothetical protein
VSHGPFESRSDDADAFNEFQSGNGGSSSDYFWHTKLKNCNHFPEKNQESKTRQEQRSVKLYHYLILQLIIQGNGIKKYSNAKE